MVGSAHSFWHIIHQSLYRSEKSNGNGVAINPRLDAATECKKAVPFSETAHKTRIVKLNDDYPSFSPNAKSPASPMPGTMYAREVNSASTAPTHSVVLFDGRCFTA